MKTSRLGVDLLFPFVFIISLWAFIPPQWESNDDITMKMIIEGNGVFYAPSSNIIFSNVIFGNILSFFTKLFGIGTYSVIITGLLISGLCVIFVYLRLILGYITGFALWALLSLWPILNVQFTVVSGVLAIAGIAVLLHSTKCRDISRLILLIISGIFLVLSYFIRSAEMLAIVFISLPFLFKKKNIDKMNSVFLIIILAVVISSYFIDKLSYISPEWQLYSAFEAARVPLSDYGLLEHILNNKDVLLGTGLSPNDVWLAASGFPIIPEIFSPLAFTSLIESLGVMPRNQSAYLSINEGFAVMRNGHILFISWFSILCLAALASWRLVFSWILFSIVIIYTSLIGRPGVLRFDYALIMALALLPIFNTEITRTAQRILKISALTLFLFNTWIQIPKYIERTLETTMINQSFQDYPISGTYVWGYGLPFPELFPVFSKESPKIDAPGFGWANLVPNSKVYQGINSGESVLEKFNSQLGITIPANSEQIGKLMYFCREHFDRSLRIQNIGTFGDLHLRNFACVSK